MPDMDDKTAAIRALCEKSERNAQQAQPTSAPSQPQSPEVTSCIGGLPINAAAIVAHIVPINYEYQCISFYKIEV